MGESIWDSIGNFFGIGVTDAERKRAKYDQLRHQLDAYISRAEDDLHQISGQINSYVSVHPVPKTKIPGIEFSISRERTDERLKAQLRTLRTKLDDAKEARAGAERAYAHYRYLAAEEDRKKG
ncbi:hypothetical protein [Sporolactobacillus putidus]|uniref:Uncharacterized protein n=1 Tax=Sporolactobacillus putidus TaxID=492735 RepID=A0A917S3B4_9BACL|nr:hypothetical protein [Sporolactobacillus putidus]GGL52010.1 hypothetical protein GCM10007968_15180 [Sporolactobacillus putidus]